MTPAENFMAAVDEGRRLAVAAAAARALVERGPESAQALLPAELEIGKLLARETSWVSVAVAAASAEGSCGDERTPAG